MSQNHKWDLIPDKSEISDNLTNQLQAEAEAKMLHSRPRPLCKSYIVLKISDVQIIWYWIKNCANLIYCGQNIWNANNLMCESYILRSTYLINKKIWRGIKIVQILYILRSDYLIYKWKNSDVESKMSGRDSGADAACCRVSYLALKHIR